jgi:hypothetical protein
MGEGLAINFGASAFNEYVRNANFNQISPRSWAANLRTGFTYDDNQFRTNQFIHPFNGSQYFNAGRSNGNSFWPSYSLALINAFGWELAGETHPDVVQRHHFPPGSGGAAVGEAQFRMSSLVFDNTLSGKSRFSSTKPAGSCSTRSADSIASSRDARGSWTPILRIRRITLRSVRPMACWPAGA